MVLSKASRRQFSAHIFRRELGGECPGEVLDAVKHARAMREMILACIVTSVVYASIQSCLL